MTIQDLLKGTKIDAAAFKPREEIFAAGTPSDRGTVLLLEGSAEAFQGASSEASRPIATYTPGSFFGLTAALGLPRMERVVAGISGAKVLFLNEADFVRYARENEKFLHKLNELMLGRIREIPTAHMRKPDSAIDLNSLFGQDSNARFDAIRQTNLKIPEYLNKMRNRLLSPGQKLFESGDSNDSLIYLVLEGEISQFWNDSEGESLVITVGPGSLFGFLHGRDGTGHLLTAKASAKGAKLIGLDDDILTKLCHVDPLLAYSVFRNILLTIAVIQQHMMRDSVI